VTVESNPRAPSSDSRTTVGTPCDVIIPVKNAVWWVDWCLTELFRCTPAAELGEVLIVDDGSTPAQFATLSRLCSRYPVSVVRNEGHPGFGGACNFGVGRTRAPYVLLLNTDCLITPGTIRKLVLACRQDPSIGLACPLSNNSPVLSLPMFPGSTYLEMNELLESATASAPPERVAIDACTVVGNCLLVTRTCWNEVGGFDQAWGIGYGEETDLQFRAMDRGFRGVAVISSYVFHFGSASFRYEPDFSDLKKKNYKLFFDRWGEKYQRYAKQCSKNDPLDQAQVSLRALAGRQGREPFIEADVLFLLPALRQGVGGIHVVMDLCNHLIRNGVKAKAAVFGLDSIALDDYHEPILFGLLHFPDEASLACGKLLKPKCVASTLFSTALPAFGLARLHGVPIVSFIQGYEVYFDNGVHRRHVEISYLLADEFITTSRWLERSIRRPGRLRPTTVLPIGANEWLFSAGHQRDRKGGKVRVGIILRSAPDKGQWVLLELMHQLLDWRDRVCITLMAADLSGTPREWLEEPDLVIRSLPLGRGNMAACFQECDIVLDASFHEGFGLVPLEAMACGAAIVCSDSGGVGQFVRHEANGLLVPEVNKPERFLAALTRLVDDRDLLRRLQEEAVRTAREFTEAGCFDGYVRFFRDRAPRAAEIGGTAETHIPEPQPLALAPADKHPVEVGPLVLRATGSDPYLLLPQFQLNGGRGIVLKVDIDSPTDTMLQLFYRRDPMSAMSDGSGLRRVLRAKDRLLVKLRNGKSVGRHEFSEERSVRCPIHRGKNLLYIELPYADLDGRLRFDPGTSPGDYVLKELEVRGVERGQSAEMAFESSKRSYLKLSKEMGYGGLEALHDLKLLRALDLQRVEWTVASAHIVTIDIESPDASVLQLYWQTKGSPWFSEDRSMRKAMRKGRNVISCLLLEPNLSGALRLNPGNADGEYSLRALEVQAIG